MTDPVLVMGVTGKTGAAVARALLERGIPVRGASRSGAGARVPDGVTPVAVDLATGRGLHAALDGVRAVHHSAPNLSVDEVAMLRHVVDRAPGAGVRRLVLHSVMHPYAPDMPHHVRKAQAEHLLHTSGIDGVVLQPAAYHQNLLAAAYAGRLAVPYATDRPFTNVDLDDVAEAAAIALLDDTYAYGTFELAGPDRLTVEEMAAQAAEVLGRDVAAERGPAPDGGSFRERAELAAMFAHYDAYGFTGSAVPLTALLGRRPTTWAESLERFARTQKENP